MAHRLVTTSTLTSVGLNNAERVGGTAYDYYRIRFSTLQEALAVWLETAEPLETLGAQATLIPDADLDTLIDTSKLPPPPTGRMSAESLSPKRRPVDLPSRVGTLTDDSPTSLVIFPFTTAEEALTATRTNEQLELSIGPLNGLELLIGLLNRLECLIVRLSHNRIDLLPRRRMRDPENSYQWYYAPRGIGFVMEDRHNIALVSWPDPHPERYERHTQRPPQAESAKPKSLLGDIAPLTEPITPELIGQIVATYTEPDSAIIEFQLAQAHDFLNENRPQDALVVLYQALYAQHRLLGPDHPDTLATAALVRTAQDSAPRKNP